jgi:urease accessory protein
LLDVYRCTTDFIKRHAASEGVETTLNQIKNLDQALHAMTLNHVAQRASKAQGVALLTLYAKSFAQPNELAGVSKLLQEMKKRIRAGFMHGHLAVCWAVFMAAVGVEGGERALAMHLFLQARSILSAAVRLNVVGPYQSHRLLAFDIKDVIADVIRHTRSHSSGLLDVDDDALAPLNTPNDFAWTWQDDGAWKSAYNAAPKSRWPLGDLLQARHDQLHSRLFNS